MTCTNYTIFFRLMAHNVYGLKNKPWSGQTKSAKQSLGSSAKEAKQVNLKLWFYINISQLVIFVCQSIQPVLLKLPNIFLETSTDGYKSSSSAWYMETIEDANITVQVQLTTEGYVSEKLAEEQGIVFYNSQLFKMTVCILTLVL